MEINEFIANFAAQFDETEESAFTPSTKFRELEEWSSLIALSVIAMVDEEYDIELKANDVINSQSIQDLFDAVKSKS